MRLLRRRRDAAGPEKPAFLVPVYSLCRHTDRRMMNGMETAKRAMKRKVLSNMDPYRDLWRSLTPAERLRRSWRMRARLPNLQAVHDAKSLPQL